MSAVPSDHGFDPDSFSPTARSEREFLKHYVPQDDDQGVSAHFERYREHQPFQSKEQGKEVYRDVDYVRILVHGNDKLVVHRPANDGDKRRFPFAWQQYQLGKEQSAKGTPLDEIGVPADMLPAFHAKHVFTAEDLSKVTDGNLQYMPAGSRDFRHKAREQLKLRQDAQASGEVAALKQQNADLLARLERLEKAQQSPPRPSRAKPAAEQGS
jgi:hypothetical protein